MSELRWCPSVRSACCSLRSFPLSGTPVVQSYWAWNCPVQIVENTGVPRSGWMSFFAPIILKAKTISTKRLTTSFESPLPLKSSNETLPGETSLLKNAKDNEAIPPAPICKIRFFFSGAFSSRGADLLGFGIFSLLYSTFWVVGGWGPEIACEGRKLSRARLRRSGQPSVQATVRAPHFSALKT